MTPSWMLVVALAVAQEAPAEPPETAKAPAPPVEEPAPAAPAPAPAAPLAVPAAPPPPAPLAMPPQGASSPPPLSEDKLMALRDYRAQRLVVRDEVEVVGGGYSVVGGWGQPVGRYGWMEPTVVLPEPAQVSRHWAIYQGRERLSVPTFLGTAGDLQRQSALESDVRRYRRKSTGWFVVGGLGLAGVVGGMVGLDQARTYDQAVAANRVLLGGTVVSAVGLFAGSVPRAKADRLVQYPALTLSYDGARQLADRYNDRLRKDLGLTPAEVWAVERRDP